jgi:hypothetical protein
MTAPLFNRGLNMLSPERACLSATAMPPETAWWIQRQCKSEGGVDPDVGGSARRPLLIGLAATTLLLLIAYGVVHHHHGRSRDGLVPIKWDAARVSGGSGHGPHRIGADRPSCLDAGIRDSVKDL